MPCPPGPPPRVEAGPKRTGQTNSTSLEVAFRALLEDPGDVRQRRHDRAEFPVARVEADHRRSALSCHRLRSHPTRTWRGRRPSPCSIGRYAEPAACRRRSSSNGEDARRADSNSTAIEADVAIVGGGPVGLALALALGRGGVRWLWSNPAGRPPRAGARRLAAADHIGPDRPRPRGALDPRAGSGGASWIWGGCPASTSIRWTSSRAPARGAPPGWPISYQDAISEASGSGLRPWASARPTSTRRSTGFPLTGRSRAPGSALVRRPALARRNGHAAAASW